MNNIKNFKEYLNEIQLTDSDLWMNAFADTSGVRKSAIIDFIEKNNIDAESMYNVEYTKKGAKPLVFGKDLMTAITSGKDSEDFQNFVSKYKKVY